MSAANCVIVGASHAGVSLALQLRREGWSGGIQLISAESVLPYHRPPLSKDILGGARALDAIALRPEQTYLDNSIELMLNAEVTAIHPQAHTATLADGRELVYSKLALCTGASVRKLPVAGQQKNIFYIRTTEDLSSLSALAVSGKRAVIIGAGYIGLEAAAQLVQKGLSVTVLEVAERILQRVTAPLMSAYYAALHSSHGVRIHTDMRVAGIEGSAADTALADRVMCADGTVFPADLVVIGIGISPNTALAEKAGLRIDAGIAVNEYAQTSNPDIYAAGDCTRHPSALYERLLRLESVQNATDQARVAAANICGKQQVYDAVPWFWSDQYHTKLQTVGIHTGYDTVVSRGDASDLQKSSFAVFYLAGDRVLAVDCINRPREFMLGKQLVRQALPVDAAVLADESADLAGLIPKP